VVVPAAPGAAFEVVQARAYLTVVLASMTLLVWLGRPVQKAVAAVCTGGVIAASLHQRLC
jgi:hypothetical protein